jgi:isopenicillin N synthase-like dioxygenase
LDLFLCSEISLEYSQRVREVARGLLKGISESLGLEGSYIDKALNLEQGKQIFVANLYPTCPQPELAMGLPPHSDHGLLTLLIYNGIGGLQIQHEGKWVNVCALPNSFLVNTGDHLEVHSDFLVMLSFITVRLGVDPGFLRLNNPVKNVKFVFFCY